MKYYRLLDPDNAGTIVRAEGRRQQEHVSGLGWVDSGVMLDYFWPDSPKYNAFEEITEADASKLIH